MSLAKDEDLFTSKGNNGMQAPTLSSLVQSCMPTEIKLLYFLHKRNADTACVAGAKVLLLRSLCLPYNGSLNTNLFCSRFGVEFHADGNTRVRPILPFEFTSCFGLMDLLRYCLAQPIYWHALDAGIPGITPAWIFKHICKQLLLIQDSNMEVFPPNQFAAPAAHTQVHRQGHRNSTP